MNRTAIVLLGLGVIGGAVPTQAQTHRHTVLPVSDTSGTALPSYSSAFEGYRPFREESTNRWRELNDTVSQVGGHVGVLKAGAGGVPPAATQPFATPPQSTRPAMEHGHHGKH